MNRRMTGLLIGLLGMVAGLPAISATATNQTVDQIVQSVNRAYPNPKALCSGGAESVRSAVVEVMAGNKMPASQAKSLADSAYQRLMAQCR